MKSLDLYLPASGLFALTDNSVRETLKKEGFAVKGMGGEVFKGYSAHIRIISPREKRETITTPRGRIVHKVKRWNERFTKGQLAFAISKALNVSPKLAACALGIAIDNAKGRNPYQGADGNHRGAKANLDIYNAVAGSGHSAHSSCPISKARGMSGI